jgi:SAM-dependent methyltransferase
MYQHPLAYLIGLEGIALMRAFTGEYDREFTEARLAEIRSLLDTSQLGTGGAVEPITPEEGYHRWAEVYDRPGNALIDVEQPIVWEILDGLPPGVALDAACGTGRHAARLAGRGHTVIGVDGSPEMLTRARAKVPTAVFHEGDLHRLPVPDQHVDVLVCGLALAHVSDLAPVLAEFARVLRPDGHLVLSDSRGLPGAVEYPLVKTRPDGSLGYVPGWAHPTSAYLGAALPLGFQVLRCDEPRRADPYVDPDGIPPAYREFGAAVASTSAGGPPDIWSLHPWSAAATNAAYRGTPAVIVWHFQLAGRQPKPPARGRDRET